MKDNIPLAEKVLQVLEDDPSIELECLETQVDMKIPGARSLELDVMGITKDHRHYNLETERKKERAKPKRARYHSSMMDIKSLIPRQEFSELPETHIIFVMEEDIGGLGHARYYTRKQPEEGISLWDRSEIMYVNAQFRDETEFGKLMADFLESDPDKMQIREMRDACSFFKKTEKGIQFMCEIFEQIKEEGREEGKKEGREEGTAAVLDILARRKTYPGEPLEATARATGCPIEMVSRVALYLPAQ